MKSGSFALSIANDALAHRIAELVGQQVRAALTEDRDLRKPAATTAPIITDTPKPYNPITNHFGSSNTK